MEVIDRLGLELTERQRLPGDHPSPVGVWDGDRFVVVFSSNKVKLALDLLRQYGWSLVRMRQLTRDMLRNWRQIYDRQRAGETFDSPASFLQTMDLSRLAQRSTADLFANAGVSAAVARDLFDSISRSIYNQDASINAFAGLTALVGAGLAGGRTLAVSGGNDRVCKGLLDLARATVRTDCRVAVVRRSTESDRGFVLIDDGGSVIDRCDAALVAVPRGESQLSIDDGDDSCAWDSSARARQQTHVSCVSGRLRASYFGLPPEHGLPQMILTKECEAIPFSSILRSGSSDAAGEFVYKIQSREWLEPEVLNRLFVRVGDVWQTTWRTAYPALTPGEMEPAFRIAERLYHPGALESVVSTLETQVVGSRNVAEMLRRDIAAGVTS